MFGSRWWQNQIFELFRNRKKARHVKLSDVYQWGNLDQLKKKGKNQCMT